MKIKTHNVIIIGSGPAGLFAAIWLERLGIDKIAIIDRHSYPAGGLLNDGKLNFDCRIGFDLDELQIDEDKARQLMGETKKIFTGFPRCKQVTFIDKNEKIEVLKNIAAEHGAQFIAPEQWHWGTDNGKDVVDYLRSYLKKTEFFLETEVCSIENCDGSGFRLICNCNKKRISYNTRFLLAAPGRSGAYWFRDIAKELHIQHNFGPIDVGIRIELNRKFYDSITDIVYDPKFIFTTSRHRDKVRTFCTNPGGRVRVENYCDFKLVNGDALSGKKTENTLLSIID